MSATFENTSSTTVNTLETVVSSESDDEEIDYVKNIQQIELTRKDENEDACVGILLMSLSGLLFAIMGALITYANNIGYSSAQMVLVRGLIQVLIVFPIMYYKSELTWDIIPKVNSKECIIWLVLRGIFGCIETILFFKSISLIDLGDATTIFSIYPVTSSFLGYIILYESIGYIHVISLILSIIGVVLIAQPTFLFIQYKSNNPHWTSYIYPFLASIFAGLSFIGMRKLKNIPSNSVVLSYSIFCIISGAIIPFIFNTFYINYAFNFIDFIVLFSIGLTGYLSNLLMTISLQKIQAGIGSIIHSSDVFD